MRKIIAVATCLAILFAPSAHAAGTNDPDDTAGRLDIKYLGAHIIGDRLEFEVSMYQEWPNRLFALARQNDGSGRSRRGYLNLYFNTRGDGRAEWNLYVEREEGTWKGRVCGVPHGPSGDLYPVCSKARVWRSEPESIQVSIGREQILRKADNTYRWRAKSKLSFARGCPDTDKDSCIDRALGKQAD